MSTEPEDVAPQSEATVEAAPPPPALEPVPQPAWLVPGAIGLAVGIVLGVGSLVLVQAVGGGSSGRLTAAVEACTDSGTGSDGLDIGDGGRTLTIDTTGEDGTRGTDIVYGLCVLGELEVPDSVMSRIEQTTSLDGQQSGSWDGITATWSYHPDRGLDMVLTLE